MYRVFVYGTLKKGFSNHDRIFAGYDIKITPAWTYGELYDLGHFPAMTEGNNKVNGELIEFEDPGILRKIDRLEGYVGRNNPDNFYDRLEVDVFVDSNTPITTWIYLMTNKKIQDIIYEPVLSGVWGKSKD